MDGASQDKSWSAKPDLTEIVQIRVMAHRKYLCTARSARYSSLVLGWPVVTAVIRQFAEIQPLCRAPPAAGRWNADILVDFCHRTSSAVAPVRLEAIFDCKQYSVNATGSLAGTGALTPPAVPFALSTPF